MKKTVFHSFIFATVMLMVAFTAHAAPAENQNTPGEAEFTVLGLCGMCKDRIERAAYGVRGVRQANWDLEAQKIKVSYRPNRTNQEEIERAIAKAGHDTENFLADDETYENLHHCCLYPREPEMLENNRRHNED